MSVRRRRHGQTILPGPAGRIGGGFVRPNAPSTNYNNGVYGPGPYGQQGGAGNDQQFPAPARPGTPPPPPPYTGKESEAPQPGGFAPPPGPPPEAHTIGKDEGAPQPGGFVVPPGPPPQAYFNDGAQSSWPKATQ
ncbi:hypothetical protein EIP91_011631 [Steccherinum ochraceum]|uniref:Uncharacterized protein n=1 Tax=Steccherinum ochraceum TaxID=92696 RepID=A0A4R0RHM6_9APHY|nr:hypothetical protein EIP91_011631 [Steccherinum ochraceum]